MRLVTQNLSKAFIKTNIELGDFVGGLYNIMAKHMSSSLSAGDWDMVIGNEVMQGVIACMQSIHEVPFVLVGHLPFSFHLYPSWPWPSLLHGATSENMGFLDRALNAFSGLAVKAFVYAIFSPTISTLSQYCPTVGLNQVVTDIGLNTPAIIPSVIGFEYPRTIFPMVEYVGAMVSRNPAPLTGELKQWLKSKPERSVVYVSMGSLFYLNEDIGKALLEGVMNAGYNLLWSLKKSNQEILKGLDRDPDRVLISDWTPQFSVLGSRAIHSAIVHGGNNGINEAMWNGVPIVVLPQMLEQVYNAGRVHFNGLGIHLDAHVLSSAKITESLRALDMGEYRFKVSRLQKMYRLAGGVERAAGLVEFYKDVGYAHLVPAYAKYQWSWVQYYNADVYALLLLTLALVVMCFLACCKCLCKRCSGKEKE